MPNSPNHGPLSAGSYSFQAYYTGDSASNVLSAKSACEPLTIVSVTPSITTSVSPASLTLGPSPVTATDTATLTGGVTPTGTIVFTVYYNDNTCAVGSKVFTSNAIVVTGDGSYTSAPAFTPTAAGTYYWIASYSGDVNNQAGTTHCGDSGEVLTVAKAPPTLATAPSPQSQTLTTTAAAVTDTATLSGGFSPTGTITFQVFRVVSGACSGSALATSTATVGGNGQYYSAPFTPSSTGTYVFVVTYSGDSNNLGFGPTACSDATEQFTVSPASPTVVTSVASTVVVNNPVTDTATLSGAFNPTGTLSFYVAGPFASLAASSCTGGVLISTATVTANGDYTSSAFTPTQTGWYQFYAVYSGDGNNNPAQSVCGSEPLQVTPQGTTLTTSIVASVVVDHAVTDTATLSGGFAPGGSISFYVSGPFASLAASNCASPTLISTSTVSGNGPYTSAPFTPTQTGWYQFYAVYSGDSNNQGSQSACGDEPLQVLPQTTLVTTFLTPSTLTLGPSPVSAYDTATLSGGFNPSGSITFTVYSDNACTASVATYTVTVNGNGNYPSPSFTPSAAGTYYWIAAYSGDSNNVGFTTGCGDSGEVLTVNPAGPSMTTTVSPSTFALTTTSTPVTDTATLSGGFNPTGSITFTVYLNDASCGVANLVFTSNAISVSGNGDYPSAPAFTPTQAGTYYWIASYTGDGNNKPFATKCGDAGETLVVQPASPNVTTQVSAPEITLADATFTVTDTATLSGAFNPTGSITFTVFDNAACTGTALFTNAKTVTGNGPYTSDPFTIPGVGTYYWIASYSGDLNNSPFTTKCGEANEVVHVSPAVPLVTTVASPSEFQLTTSSTPVMDTATLSGGFAPTGTITFTLYFDDATCGAANLVFTSNAIPVNGNGAYASTPMYTPTKAGTYYWIAAYSGDGNNDAFTTHCGDSGEVLTVLPSSPGMTTAVSPASITLGDGSFSATDTAYLTGGYSPTGSIVFTVYKNDATCAAGNLVFTSPAVPVSGNGAYTSASFPVTSIGTYYWIAAYSGDANNNPFTTHCGDSGEVLTVNPASPGLTTQVTPSTITLGNAPPYTAFDTAFLSGGFQPTGTIQFRVYFDDPTCGVSSLVFSDSQPVSGNGAYPSAAMTITAAGTYYWIASYSGDTNNIGFSTACNDPGEVVTVNLASPSMTTEVSPATITLGSAPPYTATDTAFLTGGFSPLGTITFDVFNTAGCGGSSIFESVVPVDGNGAYTSASFTVPGAGTYYWVASYSGDGNNKPFTTLCGDSGETLTVNPAGPSVSTSVSPSSFQLTETSQPVTDAATLSGGFNPTGTIVFTVYFDDASCGAGNLVFTSDSVPVSGNGVFVSTPGFVPDQAGTYYWIATYSGDGNNLGFTTKCGDSGETLTVLPAQPGITTLVSEPSITLGPGTFTVTDTATLSGAFNPTGTIVFTVYNSAGCAGGSIFSSTVDVTGDGSYTSDPFTIPGVGTYYWIASYSGDLNNKPFTTTCGDPGEVVTVAPASPSMTTVATPSTVQLTTSSAPITDTATLSGGFAPTGTISFRLYFNDPSCSLANLVFTSSAISVSGNGAYTSTPTYTPTKAGTYYWVAAYSGDSNNVAFTTQCNDANEVVTVLPALPGLVTSPSPATQTLTTSALPVTDTATLSGGFNPTGTITFQVYAVVGSACSGSALATSTATVTGNGQYPSAAFVPPSTGTYVFVVTYSGDSNNVGFGPTSCADTTEQFTVSPASPTASTAVSIESFALTETSMPVTDTATFSGGFFSPPASPSGTLTFTVYYNDPSCGVANLVFTSSPRTVDHNGAYTSDPFTPTAVGTYTWQIAYSGDLNNVPFTICGGPHETVTVTPASPTITTALSTESIVLTTGSTAVTDTATLSGGYFSPPATPSGTITFYVYYNDATCNAANLVFTSSPDSVNANGAYAQSPAFTPTAVGAYYWVAVYTGDLNNAPFTTSCGAAHEVLLVSPSSPSATTAVSVESFQLTTASEPVTDTATFSGGFFSPPASPLGTLTFNVYYNDASCGAANLVFSSGPFPVDHNGDYVSGAFTPLAVGTYTWQIVYTGDLNNVAFTNCGGDHETVTVLPAAPSATTAVSLENFALTETSTPVTDTATFSGGYFLQPGQVFGILTFNVYLNDGTCTSTPVFSSGPFVVDHNGVYTSLPFTPFQVGTYTWQIVYEGDLNNVPFTSCGGLHEVVTVTPASPTASTAVSTEGFALTETSTAVTDTATFSGGFFLPPASPSGTLTFNVYYNDASCGAANLVFTSSAQPVDHDGLYTSDPFVPTAVGTYTWQVVYTGDLNNDPFTICGGAHETVVVTPASPTASTAVSVESFALTTASVPVTDTATFSGGFFSPPATPSGVLLFNVYYNDASCGAANLVFTSSAQPVDHDGLYTSNAFTPTAVGTYTWQVVYTGDLNNNPFVICGGPHETVTVGTSAPTATTQVSAESFALTTASTAVTDTASFVDGFFSPPASPSGTLTFYVYYNDASCGAANLVFTSVPLSVDHNGLYTSDAFTPLAVGTYTWQVVYTGDLNNDPFTICGGPHETVTVTPSSPSATTAVSIEEFQLTETSMPVTDTATFSGGYFLQPSQVFGELTFNVYLNDGTCSSEPVFSSGPFTVDHNGLYTSLPFTPLQVGTYTWQIVYTGDLNNVAFTNCGGLHESVLVTPAAPTGTTALSTEGFQLTETSTPVTDTATINGGYFLQPSQSFGLLYFYVFRNDPTCTAEPVFSSGPFVVDHNGVYTSLPFTPLQVGTYTWEIVYTGDLNNVAFTNCGGDHEVLTVTPASPNGSTAVSVESFQLTETSMAVTDTATIGGGFFLQPGQAFGDLTFNVYLNNAGCVGTPTASFGPILVDHNGNYVSGPFVPDQVGTYTWQIVYTGDLNNLGFTLCGGAHEVVTVTPAAPTATTAVSVESFQLTAVSTAVTDTATFSGGFFLPPASPSGTLTFNVYYNDASCGLANLVFTSNALVVDHNGLYTSDAFTPLAVGTYTWQVVYTGDLNNVPFTICGGAHEMVTVTPAAPNGSTAVSIESFALTTVSMPVTDTATIGGGYFLQPSQAFGTLTFSVYYNDPLCGVANQVFSSGPFTVDHNGAYVSGSFTPGQVGTYTWEIVYTGDLNNVGFTLCGGAHEVVTVGAASPSILTAVSPASITLGDHVSTATDTASLSGGFNPTGTIVFTVHANDPTCSVSNLVFTSSPVTVSGNGAYTSDPFTIPGAGKYFWIAHYSGDFNNAPFTTGCGDANEEVVVALAPPTVTTVVSAESITLSDTTFQVTDTATLSGGFQPTGSIVFSLFNTAGCTGSPVFQSTVAADGNADYTSAAYTIPGAGTYSWIAQYSGDLNNNGFTTGCGDAHEVVTVSPASPRVVTQVSDESLTLGDASFSVTDTATLSGGFAPAGSILFSVYDNAACTGTPLFQNTQPVGGNGAYTSAPFDITAAGTYYWVAAYSGDGNNHPFTTGCGDAHEVVVVEKAPPTVTTLASPASITLSDGTFTATDTATLKGGFEPTGSIVFALFNTAGCTGTPVFMTSVTVHGNGDYTSAPYTVTATGTYFWIASYSGDGNNLPFTTNCGDLGEVLTVLPASPGIVTHVSAESITLADSVFTVTDTATLSGGFEPTGSITFSVYDNAACSGTAVFQDTVTVDGNADYTSAPFTIPHAGAFYWIASYSGDGNNNPFTTGCGDDHEVVTVSPAPPTVVTHVSAESITLSDTTFQVTDTATLSGGFQPAGSMEFSVFDNAGCTGTPVFTSTVSVSGNADYTSAPYTITSAGSYYWIAHYSGDLNNDPFTTGCGDAHEVVVVSPANPNVVTALSTESVVLGDSSVTVTDTATLTGGFQPTGTIAFSVYSTPGCTGTPVFTSTVSVDGNGDYTSETFTIPGAGTYSWIAAYSGDSNNNPFTTGCGDAHEVVTVSPASPSVTTALSIESFDIPANSQAVTDTATLTGGFEPTGTITFTVYRNDASCGAGSLVFTSSPITVSGNGAYTSSPGFTPTQDGTYYWVAAYSGDANNVAFTTGCGDAHEVLTVSLTPGTIIVKKIALGGDGLFGYSTTGGSTFPASFTIQTTGGTGMVTYTGIDVHNSYSVAETSMPAGWFAAGVSCSDGSHSVDPNGFLVPAGGTVTCTFTNTRSFGQITDTTFCPFDTDSGVPGQQFNVLFTKSGGAYKISATNPGQFYSNVFFYGTPGSTASITVTLPWPFVTNGAQPVHVYSGFGVSSQGCLLQFNDVSSTFTMHGPTTTSSGGPAITLGDYPHQANGNTASITLSGPVPSTGLVYVTVHIMWGLTKTGGWTPVGPCHGGCIADAHNGNGMTLPNNYAYGFAWSESSTSTSISNTVYNENRFQN